MNDIECNKISEAVYNERTIKDTVVVISCSNKKKNYECQAGELYSESVLFKLTVNYVIKHLDSNFVILSSKYGIILPTKILKPYNLYIKDLDRGARAKLVYNIYFNLAPFKKIVIFGGKDYVNIIKQACPSAEIINPLEGLTIGNRLHLLKIWSNK